MPDAVPTPRLAAPPGACDTHMHVFEPAYPVKPGAPFVPPDAPMGAYLRVQAALGLSRVVVVQSNCYGDDNTLMLDAMRLVGEAARGVAIVGPDVAPDELRRLHAAGVRGARFHMLPGGAMQWPELEPVVERIAALGWHAQVQFNGNEMPRHEARLRALPVNVVIDHIGKFLDPAPPRPDDEPFRSLVRLMERGRCWVKLSAPYESSRAGPPRWNDVAPLARELASRYPERCLWASNWPHPGRDPKPADAALLDLLLDWVDDEAARRRILVDNPASLYGFSRSPENA
jgi:D-galactarolactone isomerase